ncbi:hypothetical protein [Nonomuraea bangladeshensis]|uniref:hypothetical protein n=1 Tax=Nonomuraea bangladeshensis TaxID=404385 RepID=UPI0031DC8B51
MGRHRIRAYEVRGITNAPAPAIARHEPDDDPNRTIIVEVDAALRGQARDDAIHQALEPFRQGLRELAPVPLLALMFDRGASKN